jgi:hypothetical protein
MGPSRVNATVVLSLLLMALGVAAIVRTILLGVGGGLGILLGALLLGAGAARFYLARRMP